MQNSDPTSNFLRGQNLEQLSKIDEAVQLYESAIASNYEASGPYDRLIAIYRERSDAASVVRVAKAAIAHVRTHDEKRRSYEAAANELS